MKKFCKKKFLSKLSKSKGIIFHIVGIASIFWFLIRVVPAPYRIRYPCQQISITIALGYIAFWTALFYGLTRWIKHAKTRTTKVLPTILVGFILVFSITGVVFATNQEYNADFDEEWNPIPKEPIGTPKGVNPGRVVWVWNPDVTRDELKGFWWQRENTDQETLEGMFSQGLQDLTGENDDNSSWNQIFRYFNQEHSKGDIGYQPGEKIAIKINLNNCWTQFVNPYYKVDDERDASPYVVKALLRQLIDVVGVKQSDITVYDSSRMMANWIYNRIYYNEYPALKLEAEFPDVNFIDMDGGAKGRLKAESGDVKIYFPEQFQLNRTLPKCVVEADYLINMPLLKRHPIQNGVTLSGKNYFGTWIEPVLDVHDYHKSSFTLGDPAPQVDLLAHEHIGGKTLLYIGDGLFGTLEDHRKIAKFKTYPFNDDWTNSLFFSQDPVAMDSVMYDILHQESNPCEGSQNYLHQAAKPNINTYDPEDDGIFLDSSLGVHEHCDNDIGIFSSERYSGPIQNGIDYQVIGEEHAEPAIVISKPLEKKLYLFNEPRIDLPVTAAIGKIDIEALVNGITEDNISMVGFYVDDELVFNDTQQPYIWTWDSLSFSKHTISAKATINDDETLMISMDIWKFF